MNLNSDEIALATAARFLFESGKNEEAELLLDCSLSVDEVDGPFGIGVRYAFTLIAPPAVFSVLQDERNSMTREIQTDLYATQPKPTTGLANKFDPILGYPDHDTSTQAELLMYARGSDSPPPVVEATPSRQSSPHMLVTPIELFPVKQVRRNDMLCFIIMPFDLAFDDVYNVGIKQAIENTGMVSQRGDDIHKPGHILTQIWEALLCARFVIADLTRTNGNVLYELGLAHVLGHQAILLTQRISDIPFDLKSQRHIEYQPTREGINRLRSDLERALMDMLAE
jgi:hypothetical protein